ncbi:unnamed protein product [Ectocarpus sp. CCAP 1310/34]|nr:unnamed protein product [Ectocarpus sp. CCAP 1310/34]
MDFYLDSLDREEIKEYFARQVNISGECREEILSTDVTAYDIFDRARAEVLAVMETNFQREFVETEGFRRIVDAAEQEQRENRLLQAGGFLPPDSPPSPCV